MPVISAFPFSLKAVANDADENTAEELEVIRLDEKRIVSGQITENCLVDLIYTAAFRFGA